MKWMWLVLCAGCAVVALHRATIEAWGDAGCAAAVSWVCLVCAICAAHKKGVAP